VGISHGVLYVDSPAAESIEVYSFSGALLFSTHKPAGAASFTINAQEKALIVKGSSQWVQKIAR
jgi:hypothetical protein